MDHYLDIAIRPDPEFVTPMLLNALFAKLHVALIGSPALGHVGISFPAAPKSLASLGSLLRMHGNREVLTGLMQTEWFGGVGDHISVSRIRPAPANVPHCAVRRVQAKSNPERMRRRLIKRHAIVYEEAAKRVPEASTEKLALPWLQLKSSSTRQSFRLFILQQPAEPAVGEFNAYGLSRVATLPWF